MTVQWLVEQGANYVARDKWGDTPIHKASYGNHEAVCTFLLGKSSPSSVQTLLFLPPFAFSPNTHFFLSRSPLPTTHHASSELGCDPRVENDEGASAISMAPNDRIRDLLENYKDRRSALASPASSSRRSTVDDEAEPASAGSDGDTGIVYSEEPAYVNASVVFSDDPVANTLREASAKLSQPASLSPPPKLRPPPGSGAASPRGPRSATERRRVLSFNNTGSGGAAGGSGMSAHDHLAAARGGGLARSGTVSAGMGPGSAPVSAGRVRTVRAGTMGGGAGGGDSASSLLAFPSGGGGGGGGGGNGGGGGDLLDLGGSGNKMKPQSGRITSTSNQMTGGNSNSGGGGGGGVPSLIDLLSGMPPPTGGASGAATGNNSGWSSGVGSPMGSIGRSNAFSNTGGGGGGVGVPGFGGSGNSSGNASPFGGSPYGSPGVLSPFDGRSPTNSARVGQAPISAGSGSGTLANDDDFFAAIGHS